MKGTERGIPAAFCLQLLITMICPAFDATADADVIVMSASASATFGGTTTSKGDVYEYDTSDMTVNSPVLFSGSNFKNGVRDVDAVHLLTDGSIVFSTGAGATLTGELGENSFSDGTLIKWDGSQAAGSRAQVFLDESDFTFGVSEDVDAFHIRGDGSVLFSALTSGKLTFGTETTTDDLQFVSDDLILFNPNSITANIVLHGADFFSTSSNIDAVHELQDGQIVFSTVAEVTMKASVTTTQSTYSANDLIRFDPNDNSFALHLGGAVHFSTANLNALSMASVPEPSTFALLAVCGFCFCLHLARRQSRIVQPNSR